MASKKLSPIENFKANNYSDRATITDSDLSNIVKAFSDDIRTKLNMQDISQKNGGSDYLQPYKTFNRFYTIFSENEISNLTSYVFMTRPDCNIDLTSKDSYWENANYNANMIKLLTSNTISNNHDFISFLTDRIESCQIPDMNVKQFNTSQPLSGWMINYAGNANESLSGGTVDLTIRDDVDLRVTRLMQNWVTYIDKVVKGEVSPLEKYIYNKIFDYMSSIYYFVCDATGSRILFFSKFTGVFPLNAPLSAWSHNPRGSIDPKINVSFAYSILEHNTMDIIRDFNCNAKMATSREKCDPSKFAKTSYAKSYNTSDMTMDSIVGKPFVALDKDNAVGSTRLFLRWTE